MSPASSSLQASAVSTRGTGSIRNAAPSCPNVTPRAAAAAVTSRPSSRTLRARGALAPGLAHSPPRERLDQRLVLPARHARLHEGLLVVAVVRVGFDLVPH